MEPVEVLMQRTEVDLAGLLEVLLGRPAWHADAACADHRDVPFVLGLGESSAPAKVICQRCNVRDECLTFALEADEPPVGIWGGTSAKERRAMRRSAA